jgi:hypothetical protein
MLLTTYSNGHCEDQKSPTRPARKADVSGDPRWSFIGRMRCIHSTGRYMPPTKKSQKQSCMVGVPCNVDRSFVGGIKLVGEMEIWWHMRAAKDRTHAGDLFVCLLSAIGHFTDKSREGDVLNLGHYRNA